MTRKILSLAAGLALVAGYALASSQPLCQMQEFANPDGGGSQVGAVNSCAPLNQDGGYGTSAAICKGIGPRMTLSFQSTDDGYLLLGDAGAAASATTSLHNCAQNAAAINGSNCQAVQPVGSGEVCVSWLPTHDGGTQTLRVFKETSAPSFTDNGYNPSSR